MHFSLQAQEVSETDSSDDAASDTTSAYISDDLFIYMHSGPGTNYRILGSVTAGSAISVLNTDDDAGFTEISDERDRTGWVKSEFVSDSSIRFQLSELQDQLDSAQSSTQDQSDSILRLESQLRAAEQANIELEQQLEEQVQKAAQLEQQLSLQTTDADKEMFYRGAIVAGSGLLLGILLTLLLRRKKRSDALYDRY
ncbi:TIGR04211 family SH3 domain-containing protein [Planctobacterium marinum]